MRRPALLALALLASAGCAGSASAQEIDDTCAARVVGAPSPEQEAIIEGYRIDHPEIDIPVRTEVTLAAINDHPDGRICAIRSWTVNGIKDGDAQVGTITSDGAIATYHAPAKPPPGHKVRVAADITTPTTVGVRQVQVQTMITVLDPMASVCAPPKVGGAKGCDYAAITIPRLVPFRGHVDDPMYVRRAILEIGENDYGEPVGWSISFWTSTVSNPRAEWDTTIDGSLRRRADGTYEMGYRANSAQTFRLELTSETATVSDLALIGYQGQESALPMMLSFRRNADNFISAQEAAAMRLRIEQGVKELAAAEARRVREAAEQLEMAPLDASSKEPEPEDDFLTPLVRPNPPVVPGQQSPSPRRGAGKGKGA